MNLIPKRKYQDSGNLNVDYWDILPASINSIHIKDLAVTNAKIATLAVEDANINTCSISKLTAGNLTVIGTLTTGKFQTAASPNPRIEIGGTYIAGYSDATTKQFYLQASDGKAYFGGGYCLASSTGLDLAGDSTTLLRFLSALGGTLRGNIYSSSTTFSMDANGTTLVLSTGTGCDLWLSASGKAIYISAATSIDATNVDYIELPRLNSAPASVEGRLFYNTAGHTIVYHNGTAWKTIATV